MGNAANKAQNFTNTGILGSKHGHMAQNIASTGILGSKAMMAAGAVGLAQQGPGQLKHNHGGVAGSVMESGLMGHKGRMMAIATGMGQPEGHGGVTTQRVLGSGMMGNKGWWHPCLWVLAKNIEFIVEHESIIFIKRYLSTYCLHINKYCRTYI